MRISLSLKKIDEHIMDRLQDKELCLFFVFWLQNGRNATKAYMQMHPRYKSANPRQKKVCSVLGHRLLSKVLAKVNISDILAQYDLSIDTYFTLLKKGLKAKVTKRIKSKNGSEIVITEPDHRSVFYYHSVLGSLLGME